MPRFRLTIRKTTVTHEVIEVAAPAMLEASRRGARYADDVPGSRRGVAVVRTYDEDRAATEDRDVVAVKEL